MGKLRFVAGKWDSFAWRDTPSAAKQSFNLESLPAESLTFGTRGEELPKKGLASTLSIE